MPYKTPYQILAEKRIAESQARPHPRPEEPFLAGVTADIKGRYSVCHIPHLYKVARLTPDDVDACAYVSSASYWHAQAPTSWPGMTITTVLRISRFLGTRVDNLYTFDTLNSNAPVVVHLPDRPHEPIPPDDKGTLVCRLVEAMDKARMRPCTLARMTLPQAKDAIYRAWRLETVNVKLVTAVSIAQALGCKISDLWRLEPSVSPSENVDWL